YHAQLGRQQFLEPVYGPLRAGVLRRAARVLVSNDSVARARELEPAADRIEVLPYGISPRMTAGLDAAGSRNEDDEHGPDEGLLRLLFVGRLVYYKGVDVLLRAVHALVDVELTIVGDGPLRRELEGLAATLGLGGRVHFLGAVTDDDLRAAYA